MNAPSAKSKLRPSPTGAEQSERLSAAGLRAFFRILEAWGLSSKEGQVILGTPRSTYQKYMAHPESARLSRDTLERISYVLGIYKALHVILPSREAADTWLKRANMAPLFNGRRALDVMLGGNVGDLYQVRTYVDGLRGW